ncbi:hypothetical protein SK854_14115 [Lentzea sp. BCCO 10_0061]|uniref:Uncharacterized protein n=1 Tax=Lentzea sokolovensis TaxID=3095429 RepID=A0ABU4UUX2_9PSEU|nr:hypothetical protein [Lentzea sp. BCCO 10_0061]MDX8143259.1 hypothetical protein [Lentzea sp. BCCO 10_0061]
MSALLNTSTLSEEIGNLGALRAPVRKPQPAAKIRAAGHVSAEPEWMKTTAAYWREHDFGRGGRPAPGTPLTVSISGYGVPVGVICGRVLPYDGRWMSSSFPVLLMRPGYEPTSVSWMLSATPARNGETLLIATYDLLGCNLADGFDLSGTQVTGRFDTETVTLRARRLRLVEGEA